MITLKQRIKNLWKLSSFDTSTISDSIIENIKKELEPKPKMAQIIKRKLSIDEEVNKILQDE
jgi:hypothetical protein